MATTKIFLITTATLLIGFPGASLISKASAAPDEPTLVRAVMCESIEKLEPVNQAVVFSIDIGRVSSFTEFDPVPEQTVIYHKWYHRGVLISGKQLTINPPRWSSFSSIQLRDTDKGPWQVDVTDENGKIYQTLRFSITD